MANTFTVAGPAWLDPQTLAPGARYKTDQHDAMRDVQNFLHAFGNCGPVFSRGWPTGACKWNSTSGVDCLQIAIPPPPSAAHDTVYVRVWARSATAVGEVKFTSANSAATRTFAPTVGASHLRHAGTLDVGTVPATGDVITMRLTAGASGVVHVQRVTVEYIELGSALSDAAVGTWVPRGAGRAGADYSLPVSVGRQMRASVLNQRARVRCVYNWAGLEGLSGYSAQAWPYMPPHEHLAPVRTFRGAAAAGRTYTIRARAAAFASDDSYVRVHVGPPDTLGSVVAAQLTFGAGTGTTWQTTTFTLPEGRALGLGPVEGTMVGLWPTAYDASAPIDDPGRTNARVINAIIWGF